MFTGAETAAELLDRGDTMGAVVGGKWTLPILWLVAQESRRYGDLTKHLPIKRRVLTYELQRLQGLQLIAVSADPTDGRCRIYRLTDTGTTLKPMLQFMWLWGAWYTNRRRVRFVDFTDYAGYDAEPAQAFA